MHALSIDQFPRQEPEFVEGDEADEDIEVALFWLSNRN